ncbi:MAG: hypothetical protein FWG80_02340 [Alphaproteobacteria bacterium]|nr:hypothetical protein [Alphaproteobacteria bacterium]
MAKEREHKREYRQCKTLTEFKLNLIKLEYEADIDIELTDGMKERIKPKKYPKIIKYRPSSAHIGRIRELREQNNWSQIHKVKLQKYLEKNK